MQETPETLIQITSEWANDPSAFRNAKAWVRDLQAGSEKLWLT